VLNLCQVIGPLYSLVAEMLVVVEILAVLNKFAPLCSLRCLVGSRSKLKLCMNQWITLILMQQKK